MKIILEKNENTVNVPTNYYLVVDASGSMWGAVTDLRKTILAVAKLMSPSDTITIGSFSSYGDFDYFVRGAKPDDKNLEKLINARVDARGLTCFTQSLENLPKIVEDVTTLTGNANSAFYFLSDGYPNDRSPEKEVYNLCEKLNGKFLACSVIGYGQYYGRTVLLEMAAKIGGQFSHISDHKELEKTYASFVSTKKATKKMKLDQKYDIVWQVAGNDIFLYDQDSKLSVDVLDTEKESFLYAVNYSELKEISENLDDVKFVYSLAFVLSQRNKANIGVQLLRKAGDLGAAKMLQSSFTVLQKGRAENELKALALSLDEIRKSKASDAILLKDFTKFVEKNIGKMTIELDKSEYSSITKKGEDISKVKYVTDSPSAKVIKIVGNEDRPNVSFLTVRSGALESVEDLELSQKIADFNATTKGKKIEFPIHADTFRNYTLIANGDFNFKKIAYTADNITHVTFPSTDLEIFDDTVKDVTMKDFSSLYKTLINEKAHASVLRMYIKNNSEQKHMDDKRVNLYGKEAVPLLEELGLDYEMRYAPKKQYAKRAEDADYIPFLELTGYLEGASTISASKSYEKWEKRNDKKAPKQNVADGILFPLFEKYEALKSKLSKEMFVKTLQSTLDGIENTCDILSQELATIKFFIITTNSWFSDVDKADEFVYDGLVVQIKTQKEYI